MFRLAPFLLILLLRNTLSTQLFLSLDHGQSWQPLDTPSRSASLPPHGLLRTSPKSRPTLCVPSCAFQASLQVSVLRVDKDSPPLALRVDSADGCDPDTTDSSREVVVRDAYVRSSKPKWQEYVYSPGKGGVGEDKRAEDAPSHGGEKKRKGFFAKYGLYVMIFFVVALAQGIRKGMAELREEMEREEAAKASSKKLMGQVKVVVPKRKGSVRNRKKSNSASASR